MKRQITFTHKISLLSLCTISSLSYSCPPNEPSINIHDIMTLPKVIDKMSDAWDQTFSGDLTKQKEVGGFVFICKTKTGYLYEIKTISGEINKNYIDMNPLLETRNPGCKLIAHFHTHYESIANPRNSYHDMKFSVEHGVPGIVIGQDNNNRVHHIPYGGRLPTAGENSQVQAVSIHKTDNPISRYLPLKNYEIFAPDINVLGFNYVNSFESTHEYEPGGEEIDCNLINAANFIIGAWGDPHLTTTDGLSYDFQTVGEFTLIKSNLGDFEVQTRLSELPNSDRASVIKAVAFNIHGDQIAIYADDEKLYINHAEVEGLDSRALPNGGAIEKTNRGYLITWQDGSNIEAKFGRYRTALLDLQIQLSEAHRGQIIGLLGNFDDNKNNEFFTRDGDQIESITFDALYDVFGESWRITQDESRFVYGEGETTETFTNRLFPAASVSIDELPPDKRAMAEAACRDKGIIDDINFKNCILDVALMDDEEVVNSFTDLSTEGTDEIVIDGSRDELFPYVSTEHSIRNRDFRGINDFGVEFIGRQADFSGFNNDLEYDYLNYQNKWLFHSGRGKSGILATHPRDVEEPTIYTIKMNNKGFIQYEFFSRKSPKVEFIANGQIIHSIANNLTTWEWHTGKFSVPNDVESVEMHHHYRALEEPDWTRDFVYWDVLEPSD